MRKPDELKKIHSTIAFSRMDVVKNFSSLFMIQPLRNSQRNSRIDDEINQWVKFGLMLSVFAVCSLIQPGAGCSKYR